MSGKGGGEYSVGVILATVFPDVVGFEAVLLRAVSEQLFLAFFAIEAARSLCQGAIQLLLIGSCSGNGERFQDEKRTRLRPIKT